MDDRRVGLILRAIRRRRGWRQVDLASAAGVSQSAVSRLEAGRIVGVSVGSLRRTAAALGAEARLEIVWRGGLGDRLVDERHAALGEIVSRRLQALGWSTIPEVTFQHFSDRGSIDLLGINEAARAVCLIELESVVHSYEETQRRLDVKARLASRITEQRVGWRPRAVGVVLVVEDTSTNRRRLMSIGTLVRAGLPADARQVRRWLADPSASLRGVWFVSVPRGSPRGGATSGGIRVRRRT
jgi:transcriptional regulator with XRE-family HTH domain